MKKKAGYILGIALCALAVAFVWGVYAVATGEPELEPWLDGARGGAIGITVALAAVACLLVVLMVRAERKAIREEKELIAAEEALKAEEARRAAEIEGYRELAKKSRGIYVSPDEAGDIALKLSGLVYSAECPVCHGRLEWRQGDSFLSYHIDGTYQKKVGYIVNTLTGTAREAYASETTGHSENERFLHWNCYKCGMHILGATDGRAKEVSFSKLNKLLVGDSRENITEALSGTRKVKYE